MPESYRQVAEDQFQAYTQLPWLFLLVFAVPLAIAVWRFHCYPTRLWVGALCVSLIASLVTVFWPGFLVLAVIYDALLLIVVSIDFVSLYLGTSQGIEVSRDVPRYVFTWGSRRQFADG